MSETILSQTINKQITRRSFLKWSAAIGATASVAGLMSQRARATDVGDQVMSPVSGREDCGGKKLEWVPSVCLVCHSFDALAVGVEVDDSGEGLAIRKIEGQGGQPKAGADGGKTLVADRDYITYPGGILRSHPGTRSRICAKGTAGLEHTYNPDRVRFPLRRCPGTDRGAGKWERISWTDAYAEIGAAMKEVWDAEGSTAAGLGRNNFLWWKGRDETYGTSGRFTSAFGTVNTIGHTSICESSRHVAQETMFGPKFPLGDLTSHTDLSPGGCEVDLGVPAVDRPVRSVRDDIDFLIEFGGNAVGAKIPSYMYAQRWADRKSKGCRIAYVDVRQAEAGCFADEWIPLPHPGTDALLANSIAYVIMTADGSVAGGPGSGGWEETGYPGGHYGAAEAYPAGAAGWAGYVGARVFGLYPGEAAGCQGVDAAWPTCASYISYLDYVKSGGFDPTAAATALGWDPVTGAALIRYLARAISHQDILTENCGKPGLTKYCRPHIDCYRGPCKHTNGYYGTRAVRMLQVLTGHIDTPGGQCHNDGGGNVNGGIGGGVDNRIGGPRWDQWDWEDNSQSYPIDFHQTDQNLTPSMLVGVGEQGGPGGGYTAPSYAYVADTPVGVTTANVADESIRASLRPKMIMFFKNAPSMTRPDTERDRTLFTAKWGDGEYKVKYMFAVDIQMGEAASHCDWVVPDTSYLERYDSPPNAHHALGGITFIRQPVLRASYPDGRAKFLYQCLGPDKEVTDGPKPIGGIYYELARYIATNASLTLTGQAAGRPGGDWHPSIGAAYNWVDTTLIAAGAAATLTDDGTYANEVYTQIGFTGAQYCPGDYPASAANAAAAAAPAPLSPAYNGNEGAAVPAGTSVSGLWAWILTNGCSFTDGGPDPATAAGPHTHNYYVGGYTGGKRLANQPAEPACTVGKILVYHPMVAAWDWHGNTCGAGGGSVCTNVTHGPDVPAGNFSGLPVYQPILTNPGTADRESVPYNGGTDYPLHLSTFKWFIHTQSRTASLPRLCEVVPSNPAWMHPATAAGLGLSDGSLINIHTPGLTHGETQTAEFTNLSYDHEHTLECVKIITTLRCSPGCVIMSNSFGHVYDGEFDIDCAGAGNRSILAPAANSCQAPHFPTGCEGTPAVMVGPDGSPSNLPGATTLTPATATQRGWNPNHIILRQTCPIGSSQAWFDTPCRVTDCADAPQIPVPLANWNSPIFSVPTKLDPPVQ